MPARPQLFDPTTLLQQYAAKRAPLTLFMVDGTEYHGQIQELDQNGFVRFTGEANRHILINTALVTRVELGRQEVQQ